ncbi:MAG: rhomboid family intramembrane serine protease [Bradymonadaceae bacterium]|nr:rhomboid family intramembrane serine protease [Lujinxingiaceae bacterium]
MAQYRMYWPPVTRNFKIIAGVLFGLWIASVLIEPLGAFMRANMLVSRDAVVERHQIWTLLSYSLWHADFFHLLFNLFVLYIFGSEIDRAWKPSTWWRYLAICALGGGIVVVLSQLIFSTNYPTLGFSGAVMGVVAAYAWYHWDQKLNFLFIPMTGKMLLLVFIGIDIFFVVFGREAISIAGHLGGMATGLLLVTGYWRPAKLKQILRHRRNRNRLKLLRRPPETKPKRNGVDKPN